MNRPRIPLLDLAGGVLAAAQLLLAAWVARFGPEGPLPQRQNNAATLPLKLSRLLGDRDRLDAIKASAKRLGKPRAAFDAAQVALDLVGGSDGRADSRRPAPRARAAKARY